MTAYATQTGTTFDTATAEQMTEVVVNAILDVRRDEHLPTEAAVDLVANAFHARSLDEGGDEFADAVRDFVNRVGERLIALYSA